MLASRPESLGIKIVQDIHVCTFFARDGEKLSKKAYRRVKATVVTWHWSQITWIKSVRAHWEVHTKRHDGAGGLQKK